MEDAVHRLMVTALVAGIIPLVPEDFEEDDTGEITLDGMPADQWIEAMSMD